MKYLPLLDLQLQHAYYPDERCPDFQIIPTAITERHLKNHRATIRFTPNGLRILLNVTASAEPVIPLTDGTTFAFQLQLLNPNFPLFTDLDAYHQILAPIYTNSNDTSSLALTAKQTQTSEPLAVTQLAQNVEYTLAGSPRVGLTAADFTLTGLGPVTTPTAYHAAAKRITVDTTAATDDLFQVTYLSKPPPARGVFAQVEIQYRETWPAMAAGAKQFQITFAAKLARWKYYIIADAGRTAFQIANQADALPNFSEANRTDLNQNPDTSDSLAQALAQKHPTKQRLRFVADEQVPCQLQPRKTLQLQLTGIPVIDSLPNPSINNYELISASGNGGTAQETVLYQIVNYFTH